MVDKNIITELDMEAGAGTYVIFKSLNLSIESCLAELVDNAISSYEANRKIVPKNFKLKVDIKLDHSRNTLEVDDNAFGIAQKDMKRAFKTGIPPADNTGGNEFGAGMKVSSFWLGDKWTVLTSAIGEAHQSTIICDIDDIQKNGTAVSVIPSSQRQDYHGTNIFIENMTRFPQSKNKKNIIFHLGSKFRKWINNGSLLLTYDGVKVTWEQPKILTMQSVRNYQNEDWKSRPSKEWKEEVHYKFGDGREIEGFVGILEDPGTDKAGFNLMRRGRVIQGGTKAWKPGLEEVKGLRDANIFEHERSYMYARLYGELNFKGFRVDNHKTNIEWSKDPFPDNSLQSKQEFLAYLFKKIKKDENYTDFWYQLNHHLSASKETKKKEQEKSKWAEKIDETAQQISEELQNDFNNVDLSTSETDPADDGLLSTELEREFKPSEWETKIGQEIWKIKVKPHFTKSIKMNWFKFNFIQSDNLWPQEIIIEVNLAHEFSQKIFRIGGASQRYDDVSPAIYNLLSLFAIQQRKMQLDEVQNEKPGTYIRAINRMLNKIYKNHN